MTMVLDGTNGETFPSWTTSGRPASPTAGQMGYNTTTGNFDAYTANGWVTLIPSASGSSTQVAASNMPTGSIIQTVIATAASFSTTSTSFVATGLTATITPILSTSTILTFVSWSPYTTTSANELDGALYKNGSQVVGYFFDAYNSSGYMIYSGTSTYSETPGSTSAITYAMYLKSATGGNIVTGGSSQAQRMIVMEIR